MIVEALLANAVILLGLALILWVISLQIDDVSFVDAYWGGGMALMALVSWLRLYDPGPLATLLMAMTVIWGARLCLYLFLRCSPGRLYLSRHYYTVPFSVYSSKVGSSKKRKGKGKGKRKWKK